MYEITKERDEDKQTLGCVCMLSMALGRSVFIETLLQAILPQEAAWLYHPASEACDTHPTHAQQC